MLARSPRLIIAGLVLCATLAQAIAYLFEHPKTAAVMGQAARDRVQKKFSWQQHVDSYDRLYRKLVKFD